MADADQLRREMYPRFTRLFNAAQLAVIAARGRGTPLTAEELKLEEETYRTLEWLENGGESLVPPLVIGGR